MSPTDKKWKHVCISLWREASYFEMLEVSFCYVCDVALEQSELKENTHTDTLWYIQRYFFSTNNETFAFVFVELQEVVGQPIANVCASFNQWFHRA